MHRTLLPLATAFFVTTALAADPAAPPSTDPTAQAQAVIHDFKTNLQGELKTALSKGGPAAAIEFCQKRAPQIATEVSESSGWQIRRVTLKPRNPDNNVPDAWERQGLATLADKLSSGAPQPILVTEEVTTPNGRVFRYMQAIPVAKACLTCHGDQLTPEVTAALDKAYPNDQARGYTIGQLRGAFSLSKPLPAAE
ncbi:DUF3365 domain-containing protein [Rhodopseudomonas palustris]|uniref:DUF3365 domain-containing protein n=1 Tax=Thiospirillum jenense TaxID=1653858 RepID=A0A839H386_9GAMM|nr:DUF3365 domain-containing protein [Thiospirillum jenense]MBB1089723.1 DUF3365 domain-containing protein [Rhodopseudomonas palustris]MBB1124825.1 DUF3365 domain-containing protein [Thiospirillum jenense]